MEIKPERTQEGTLCMQETWNLAQSHTEALFLSSLPDYTICAAKSEELLYIKQRDGRERRPYAKNTVRTPLHFLLLLFCSENELRLKGFCEGPIQPFWKRQNLKGGKKSDYFDEVC